MKIGFIKYRGRVAVGLAVVAMAWVVWQRGWGGAGSDYRRYHDKSFEVVRVIDGDTFDVGVVDEVRGKPTTRIRLWGVDTPETEGSPGGAMLYGAEAKAFTTQQLSGRAVRLFLEPYQSNRDKYGRLLAYVFLDDELMLNELLVREGMAYADERFEHIYRDRFLSLQRRSQKEGKGLWGVAGAGDYPQWYRRRHAE